MNFLSKWLNTCQAANRGKIFLDNLGIDLNQQVVGGAHLECFCAELLRAPVVATRPGDMDPWAMQAYAAITAGGLRLSAAPCPAETEALACVVRFDQFLSRLWFDQTDFGGPSEFQSEELVLELVQAPGALDQMLRRNATIGHAGSPVAWVALDQELTELLRHEPLLDQADAARNHLGLLHYNQDFYLCRVIIPATEAARFTVRRPTAFDGGPNLVYRSSDMDCACGWTIDLTTLQPSLREFVTSPILLNPTFRFEALGRLTTSAAFSWAQLAATTEEARITAVAARLQVAPTK